MFPELRRRTSEREREKYTHTTSNIRSIQIEFFTFCRTCHFYSHFTLTVSFLFPLPFFFTSLNAEKRRTSNTWINALSKQQSHGTGFVRIHGFTKAISRSILFFHIFFFHGKTLNKNKKKIKSKTVWSGAHQLGFSISFVIFIAYVVCVWIMLFISKKNPKSHNASLSFLDIFFVFLSFINTYKFLMAHDLWDSIQIGINNHNTYVHWIFFTLTLHLFLCHRETKSTSYKV